MSNKDVILKAIDFTINKSSGYPVQLKVEFGGHRWKIIKPSLNENYFIYKNGVVFGEVETSEEAADVITGEINA